MTDLAFDFEWVDPQGARGAELRATWARLSIRVGTDVVTRAVDAETRAVRQSVYVPLYPVAEWFASNWWCLLYEVDSPQRSTRHGYHTRHSLTSASEGFSLPPLVLDPMGEVLRLSWSQRHFRHCSVEFVDAGSAYLDRSDVEEVLRGFIQAVILRLEDEGVWDTFLQTEWSNLTALEPEEQAFCRLAASLGVDPFDTSEEQQQRIEGAASKVPPELHEEFFYSADLFNLLQEAESVDEALQIASRTPVELRALCSLRQSFSAKLSHGMAPWREGYEAARALRSDLSLDGEPLSDFSAIARALDVPAGELEQAIGCRPGLSLIDGVVGFNERQSPGFVVRSVADEAKRFTFCRELFEYLSVPDGSPLIVTRARTERQKRNRAFAAEFLLPSEFLRERVDTDRIGSEVVDDIASTFGVSWAVVVHQLENHGISRLSTD